MRGPSSSHTAASVRIGNMARDLLGVPVRQAQFEFDPNGSLASTYQTQGSDIGLAAGLMGMTADDEQLNTALELAKKSGLEMLFKITGTGSVHPNTYHIRLFGETDESVRLVACSTGGGAVEIISLDEFHVSMKGDFYETLLFYSQGGGAWVTKEINRIKALVPNNEEIIESRKDDRIMLQIRSTSEPERPVVEELARHSNLIRIRQCRPVLPVLSGRHVRETPFLTVQEMNGYRGNRNMTMAELALEYESKRGGISKEDVFNGMLEIVKMLIHSIQEGVKGTRYDDRILHSQVGRYMKAEKSRMLLQTGLSHKVTIYTMAMMEQKSAFGLIAAAPTAGSCGTVPGTLIGAAEEMGKNAEMITDAFLAAGLIGLFIASQSTFAAEIGGCQAECGSASGMAAAGLVQLSGGTVSEGLAAASMALQNSMGMICDPVANRVEVPCLGKNIQASVNALASANMAMAGIDPVIPLDEVILAMDDVGHRLPRELCCTGLAGLSVTPTSKKIREQLEEKKKDT